MKNQIPNLITLSNLVCGVLSIWTSFTGDLTTAAFFIYAGAIFDFLDGGVARLLKVSSEMGKQLDSLSDLVTFGVAPGFIAYQLFQSYEVMTSIHFLILFIPVFSAVRLANFNIDSNQTSSFIGLPTPANGFFWASLASIDLSTFNPELLLPALAVVMSILLVSKIKLFSLKFSNFSWSNNEIRFIFLILSAILFALLYFNSIPIIVLLYIIISIINSIFFNKNEIQSGN